MKKILLTLNLFIFVFSLLFSSQPQVKNPSLQEELSNPFCFFLVPSDELGFKNSPKGSQITYDGAIFTGHGELDFFIGPDFKPVNQRIRTLYRDYIPVYTYIEKSNGITYTIKAFAAPLNLNPLNILINFIEIKAENKTKSSKKAGVGFSFVSGKGKFRRCKKINYRNWYEKKFMKSEIYTKKELKTEFGIGNAYKNKHFVFSYEYNGDVKDFKISAEQRSKLKIRFSFTLKPDEKESFIIKMPYVPIYEERTKLIKKVVDSNYTLYLKNIINFWERELSKGTQIFIPEKKVNDTIKAGFAYLLMARDTMENGRVEQHVNQFQYDFFYPRDGAYMARVYNMYNRLDFAKGTVNNFIKYDKRGNPTSFVNKYPDDWGQSLWAVGSYFRTSKDLNFIKKIYKIIPDHINRFINFCKKDPIGLWPVAGPYDNEAINGHYTGHSFWALLGLNDAIFIAKTLKKEKDAIFFEKVYKQYKSVFFKILKGIIKKTGGYIPPGLDKPEDGYDWANASAGVYPFEILSPYGKIAEATSSLLRKYKYREGIMTYGPNAYALKLAELSGKNLKPGWLHHYETFYVTETLLAMGKQEEVIEDLHSILAHTGSTNDGFEFSVKPWSNRDTGHNFPPHGWFAARYNELVRNMLVREFKNELHLFSAISPEWVKPGNIIKVQNGLTYFGKISMQYKIKKDGAKIEIKTEFNSPPEKILFHIPYFAKVKEIKVDGKKAKITNLKYDRAVVIQKVPKIIKIRWKLVKTKKLNFKTAAISLLKKYHSKDKNFNKKYLF